MWKGIAVELLTFKNEPCSRHGSRLRTATPRLSEIDLTCTQLDRLRRTLAGPKSNRRDLITDDSVRLSRHGRRDVTESLSWAGRLVEFRSPVSTRGPRSS